MKKEDVVKELRKRFENADVKNIEGTVAVQIDLKDDDYSNIYLEVKDKVLSIEPYDYYDRIAKITVDSKDLLDIIDKKLDMGKAFSDNLIAAEGDVQKCIELLKLSKNQVVKEEAKPKEVAKAEKKPEIKQTSTVKTETKKETTKPKQAAKATAKSKPKASAKSKAKK